MVDRATSTTTENLSRSRVPYALPRRAIGTRDKYSCMATNISTHAHAVTDEERAALLQQRPAVVWLTGLSGSGKSTVAGALDRMLLAHGAPCYVLDGDNVRGGLNSDLGFSPADRTENVRRVREVAKLLKQAGLFVLVPLISPYRAGREAVRASLPPGDFVEVFVRASVAACEGRDPKGLYAKARRGEIKGFTGIDAPYEEPESPELVLDAAGGESPEQLAGRVIALLQESGRLGPAPSLSSSSSSDGSSALSPFARGVIVGVSLSFALAAVAAVSLSSNPLRAAFRRAR